jgi:Ca2+-binding RTX toxin-like protein
MTFLLLGILSTALIGTVAFDWFDGKDEDQNVASQQEDAIGQELNYDGSGLLEGTDGNDTVSAGQGQGLAPDTINLLGGDDIAIIEDQVGGGVSGGEGHDSITSTAAGNVLFGNAGDDTLAGVGINDIFGGEGHDRITSDIGNQVNESTTRIEGGDGNDNIIVETDALIPEIMLGDLGNVDIRGGEGADEIKIVYDLADNLENMVGLDPSPDSSDTFVGDLITVRDFVPGEDVLTIEVKQDPETVNGDITVELDQTEADGTYTSLITLTFAETSDTTEASNVLTVLSSVPFTLDDIQLVGV